MDEKDLQIIRELQKDGRLSNNELSERVNLSPSPCLRRVKNLERAGIITGYAALIDQAAFGLPVTVFVRIRLKSPERQTVGRFEARLGEIDEVLDCYLMAGNSDYLLRVIVESLQAYEVFVREKLHTIPAIASIESSFAFGTVKRNRSFP